MQKKLKYILSDNKSGSSDLVFKINRLLKTYINNTSMIRCTLNEIKISMQKFEVVMKYAAQINTLIESGNKKALSEYIRNYESENLDVYYKIYQNVKAVFKNVKTIFTLSNSKTIYEVLKCFYSENNNIKVIVSESRPALEGRILAKKLLKIGIKVTVITENQIADSIAKCDAVFLGADKILLDGDVVNKTGSKNAVIIARHYLKPVFVLSSSDKFSKQKKFKPTLQNLEEIWKYKHPNLKIENRYFEVVPQSLITKIVTEIQ